MEGLLEAATNHTTAVSMCLNVSKAKVISALIRSEHRQAALIDVEPV